MTGPSGAPDGGQHRRRGAGATQRVGVGVLLAGIAVATVLVPPLITRDAAAPPAPVTPPVVPLVARSSAPSPRPSSASPSSSTPQIAACAPVARGASVALTTSPSCGVYLTGLGNGWTARGDGLKILPGQVVPGTDEAALRVERSRPALPQTAMTLRAAAPIGVAGGDRLRLRVWGGRQFGTVVRLSVEPSSRGPVTLAAPADRWTDYTVRLSDLSGGRSLSAITLVVAADQVPHVNRFFLDDITIAS